MTQNQLQPIPGEAAKPGMLKGLRVIETADELG